jgi:hypothetical protein
MGQKVRAVKASKYPVVARYNTKALPWLKGGETLEPFNASITVNPILHFLRIILGSALITVHHYCIRETMH